MAGVERAERSQAPRSSACRVDSSGITGSSSSSSGGSQSVHRHTKVLVTRLQERNVHCLDKKAAGGQKAQLTQTFTGHAGDGAPTGASDYEGVERRREGLSFLLRVDGDIRIKQ